MMNNNEMNDRVENAANETGFQKVLNWFRQAFTNKNLILVDPAEYLYMNQCI